jgi:hypothetical protein
MGEKKKKEAAQKKWTKVGLIILAVLFVVVMVVSSMGSSWITGLAPVRPGDSVVLDYTIYDIVGNPLLTSNQQLYQQVAQSGKGIMYAKQLTLTANQSLNQGVYPVSVFIGDPTNGTWSQFALLSPEYDAMTQGLVGMRVSEKKNIVFTGNSSMTQLWSPAQLERNNLNISSLQVGDTLAMGVSDNPNGTADNSSAPTYIRIGEVSRISPSLGAVVNFGYPRAEVSVISVTKP